jgi:hypothetical protein
MELSKEIASMEFDVEVMFEALEKEQIQLDEITNNYEKKIEELS